MIAIINVRIFSYNDEVIALSKSSWPPVIQRTLSVYSVC